MKSWPNPMRIPNDGKIPTARPTSRPKIPEARWRNDPYAKGLKSQVTLRLGIDVIEYFKALAEETDIPYQNLINLYLRECAHAAKKPTLSWAS